MESDNTAIRWKHRFQNFSRAFNLLRTALENKTLDAFSDLEQEGLIQRFEYTFELGWKTFKDYLEFSGVNLSEATPRKVIKECAALNIFSEAGINSEIYMDMLLSRNALSHTYDFDQFKSVIIKIKEQYLTEFESEYIYFTNKESRNNV